MIKRWLRTATWLEPQMPLFTFEDGRSLTLADFRKLVKSAIVERTNLPPSRIGLASFRNSMAIEAQRAGVERHRWRALGNWRGDAGDEYNRRDSEVTRNVGRDTVWHVRERMSRQIAPPAATVTSVGERKTASWKTTAGNSSAAASLDNEVDGGSDDDAGVNDDDGSAARRIYEKACELIGAVVQITYDVEVPVEHGGDDAGRWVQCDRADCRKWRRLPDDVDFDALPGSWYCSMNHWDPSRASCGAPQEIEIETVWRRRRYKGSISDVAGDGQTFSVTFDDGETGTFSVAELKTHHAFDARASRTCSGRSARSCFNTLQTMVDELED